MRPPKVCMLAELLCVSEGETVIGCLESKGDVCKNKQEGKVGGDGVAAKAQKVVERIVMPLFPVVP